jgi:hypothetical protein
MDGAGIKYLSAGIGITKKRVAAPGNLPSAYGSENQEGEDDRAVLTQRTLLSTEELRMLRASSRMPTNSGFARQVANFFFGFFHTLQKNCGLSETGV